LTKIGHYAKIKVELSVTFRLFFNFFEKIHARKAKTADNIWKTKIGFFSLGDL
jgi:hypothetical protein